MADPPLVGQVVRSTSGRDRGRLAVVVGVLDERYVEIADGEIRRVQKPKKKNMRHLEVLSIMLESIKNGVVGAAQGDHSALSDEVVARELASLKP